MNGVSLYAIQRDSESIEGTFGTFYDPTGKILCYTCELPWQNNAPSTSRIPSGIYSCIPHNSPKHPHTWEIANVPNRTEILIHNGNTIADSNGCILIGTSEGWLGTQMAVLNSMSALNMLRDTLPDTFSLSILDITDK